MAHSCQSTHTLTHFCESSLSRLLVPHLLLCTEFFSSSSLENLLFILSQLPFIFQFTERFFPHTWRVCTLCTVFIHSGAFGSLVWKCFFFYYFWSLFSPSLSHNHSTTALYCLAVANCPFLSLFPPLSQTLHHTFLLFSLFDGVCVFCLASVSERVCLCECGISFVITTLSNKNINIR